MVSTHELYAEDRNVYAYRCPKCGALYHPAPMVCKACRNRRDPSEVVFPDFQKVEMGGPCRLLTWTRIYALPEGIDRPSVAFGIVAFENGLRALGSSCASLSGSHASSASPSDAAHSSSSHSAGS